MVKFNKNEFWIFALQSVHQDASFDPSDSIIRWFLIFTLVRGDPFDKGWVQAVPQEDKMVKNGFKVFFLDLMAFRIHMNVRAKTITKLGF